MDGKVLSEELLTVGETLTLSLTKGFMAEDGELLLETEGLALKRC